MSEREDRDRLREDDDCEKEFQTPLEDLCLPEDSKRRPKPCDPPEEDCVDDFHAPEGAIRRTAPDYQTPDPLELGNIEITLNCLPSLSDTVGVYPPNVEDLFYWEMLPGITLEQLDFINGLDQGTRNSAMGAATGVIETTLGITTEQAEYFESTFGAAVLEAASSGGYGSPSVTAVNTFTDRADWRSIPNLADSKLDYISNLDPGVQASAVSLNIADLETTFKLSTAQATYFRELVDGKVSALNDIAFVQTQLSLRCYWENVEQIVDCPAGTLSDAEGAGLTPAANNDVTVAAGVFQSFNSQDEADDLALTSALSQLVCWYGNEVVNVECTDPNPGYPAAVPGSITANPGGDDLGSVVTTPTGPNLVNVIQVGAVTVPLDNPRFASRFSRDDATNIANAYAVSKLECRYLNTPQESFCEDPLNPGVFDTTTGPHAGPVTITVEPGVPPTGLLGQSANVEAAYVVSEVSPTDANDSALSIAASLLDCYYSNEPVTVQCTAQVLLEDGTVVTVEPTVWWYDGNTLEDTTPWTDFFLPGGASVTGTSYYPNQEVTEARHGPNAFINTVAEDTVRSYIDKNDANALAENIALASLYCIYCSHEVEPLCESTPVSLSQTLGLPAGAICGPDIISLQAEANTLARIPVVLDGGDDDLCEYGNDALIAACVEQSIPGQGFGIFPPGTDISESSAPAPGESILIPANVIVIYASAADAIAAKEEANAQAEALATAIMQCFFTNVEIVLRCDGTSVDPIPEEDLYRLHESSSSYPEVVPGTPPSVVDVAGNEVGKVKLVPETTFSYVSQVDADEQAQALASALLVCLYTNLDVTATCQGSTNVDDNPFGLGLPDAVLVVGGTPVPEGAVGNVTTNEGDVVSNLGPQAVQLAKVIAAAQLVCLYQNDPQNALCSEWIGTGGDVNDINIGWATLHGTSSQWVVNIDDHPGVTAALGEVVVPAGEVISSLSIADANQGAETTAQALLFCAYGNKELTIYCDDAGIYVENHTAPTRAGIHYAEGSDSKPNDRYTLAANTVVMQSQYGTVANAIQMLKAGLQCLYVTNLEASGSCVGASTSGDIAIHTGRIPAGTLMSAKSSTDALEISETLAQALTLCGTSTSGSTSGPGSTSGGTGGSGSSKDTAIVPAPWLGEEAYTALFVEEQPEVVFSDHFDAPITKRVSRFKLDKRFFEVCAPNTIKIVGLVADHPGVVGAEILEDTAEIIIRVGWFSKIKRVTGRVSGVRKGFDGLRLPPKTKEDFESNEKWLRR